MGENYQAPWPVFPVDGAREIRIVWLITTAIVAFSYGRPIESGPLRNGGASRDESRVFTRRFELGAAQVHRPIHKRRRREART